MLYKKLINYFLDKGFEKIYVKNIKFKKDFNPFQTILINILVKDYGISFERNYGKLFYEENNIKILRGEGNILSDITVKKNGEKIELDLPEKPLFVIDLSFYSRHTPKEKKRLKKQISFSLYEVRKYLWDRNLVLTGLKDFSEFEKFLGKNKVQKYRNINEFLKKCEPKKVIILDPYAEKELDEKEIKEADCFLIGGLIDLGIEMKYETQRLFKDLNFESRSIKLKGNIKGVPDRINRIISILLKVKYLNYSLKEAIFSEQTRKDILSRLQIELPKIWIKRNGKFYVKREDLKKISKELFGGRDLRKYLKVFKVSLST